MKRLLLIVTLLFGVLLSIAPAAHIAAAQTKPNPLAGTKIEMLSSGVPANAGGRALLLLRVTMKPGTVIPAHQHPGPVSLYVEQGTFGTEFFGGTGQITRAATGGKAAPVITLKPGDNITMNPGDHLFYDGATHTMRNDGSGDLVLLVAALFDPERPGFLWAEDGPAAHVPGAERRMP